MTNYSTGSPDQIESSHDCYRLEFTIRTLAEPSLKTLNICGHTQSAIARFSEDIERDSMYEMLSTVLAPAEYKGITVSGKLDTVTVLETDPLVAKISLSIDP